MSRPRVAIAHDYLTQRGGAERVVLSLLKAFPDARIHTTLYDPDGTYPEFRDADVVTSPLNRVGALRRDHRLALPLLAPASSRLRIDADVTVASSSGWAHGFAAAGRLLVYAHAPARWLYRSEEYLGGSLGTSPTGLALAALRPPLRRWDRAAARRADAYLCNSRVVQERIRAAYGIDAAVVPPPFGVDTGGEDDPVPGLEDWADGYALVVSRLLPYKNVDRVIAALGGRHRLVVVGSGPERDRLAQLAPEGVRLVQDLSDAQMRWVYRHATMLVAASHEDFGLTPLEAGAFGRPVVALRGGGYLDTVVEGRTGLFFDEPTSAAIAAAVRAADAHPWDPATITAHVETFGEERFIARIRAEVDALAAP